MYNSGFIIIYRDETEDWLFQDPQLYHWWTYLRMKATPKPCIQTVGKTRIRANLNYGDFATTISYLSRAWDADERTVASFLDLLEQDGRISIRRENGISIINIKEYVRFSPPAGYFAKGMRRGMARHTDSGMPYEMEPQTDSEMPGEMSSDMRDGIHTNKINLEEEKLTNSTTPAIAHEEAFFEKLKQEEATMEQMCMNMRLPGKDALLEQLELFKSYVMPGEKFHDDYGDFKRHFMSWYRSIEKKVNSPKKKSDGTNDQKQNGGNVADRRRGSEGSARSAEDYDQPFPTRERNE